MQFARLDGTVFHYQLIGAPKGKPVIVFINSLGTDFRIWRDVVIRLAGEAAIILYDKRGHGLSELGDAPAAIETHARDLANLMDHLAITRATICGLSIGGLIAQALYTLRPALIDRLILSNTAQKVGTAQLRNERIAAIDSHGIEGLADAVMQRWFTPDFHARRHDELQGYRTMLVRQSVAGYKAACAALRDADFTETARRIAVPALCITGDGDGSSPPAVVKELADLIPEARFEIIAGCGHIPCIEQPEAHAALIRDFIALPPGDAAHG